jgi:hypothetical protein
MRALLKMISTSPESLASRLVVAVLFADEMLI